MTLEYTTYWLEISPRAPLQLPEGAGSLVRGTFGRALRRMTCVTGAASCEGCVVADRCGYREIFDPVPPASHALQNFSAIPPPYVLHVGELSGLRMAAGRRYRLGITLVGKARRSLGLVVLALRSALEEGWLRERVSLVLHDVLAKQPEGDVPALDLGKRVILPHSSTARLDSEEQVVPEETSCKVEMEWVTPTALKQDGREAGIEDVQARTWLMTLVRRIALLTDFYGERSLNLDFQHLAELASRCRIVSRRLVRMRWDRYSARQTRSMPMGGLVGELQIEGPLQPFIPLMEFARGLHVGRHAAFGQGAYRFAQIPG